MTYDTVSESACYQDDLPGIPSMSQPSPHEWLRPKLIALLSEAEAQGIARDVSIAVITDLVNGPLSVPVPPPSEDNPDQDLGEPESMLDQNAGHMSTPEEPVGGRIIGAHVGRLRRHR